MTKSKTAKKRRMAALQPSNSARLNIPTTVSQPNTKPATRMTHGKITWRPHNHTLDPRSASRPVVQYPATGKSITSINTFCRDFTFTSTLNDMSRLRLPTPVIPYFAPMKTSVVPTCHIVPMDRYRAPMPPAIFRPPLGRVLPPSNVIPYRPGAALPLNQYTQELPSTQPSRKVKNLPLRKAVRGERPDDEIRFVRDIPIIPEFPLPVLPIIPDLFKAREALRHRSSDMLAGERSYDMAALMGDAQAEVYCREYAYELRPHLNTHLTTQIKSCIVRNTTWAQLSVRYDLGSKILCPIHARSRLQSKPKVQADLFEAHIGAFWLSFPTKERDSKASPILRAYFRQLLDHLFPIFHQAYTSSGSHVPVLLPPRPTLVPHRPAFPLKARSHIDHGDHGSALKPIPIEDDEKTDEDASDSDDAWFEVIGSNVLVPRRV